MLPKALKKCPKCNKSPNLSHFLRHKKVSLYWYQIGTLEGHFLLEHPRISRRSTDRSLEHHGRLEDEPDIAWFEQQKEVKRPKRDAAASDLDMPGETNKLGRSLK